LIHSKAPQQKRWIFSRMETVEGIAQEEGGAIEFSIKSQ